MIATTYSATATAERATPTSEKKRDMEVDVNEGEFAEACEICFVRPTAVCVEVRLPELEAAQKMGSLARTDVVERRFFCAEHIYAADMVYRSY